MCISLAPLNVDNPFITANQISEYSVVVSYSIMTSEPKISFNSRNQTIYAWFLPLKDIKFEDVKILNLSTRDKSNIDLALSFVHGQNERSRSAKNLNFGIPKGLSDVVTLEDGSQVVRAANPMAILNEINNVHPEFKEKLSSTASIAINATNEVESLKNSTCLVYLFKGSSQPSRSYLAYSVPFNPKVQKEFYIPTVENDHTRLSIPAKTNRDATIMWGGWNKNHKGSTQFGIKNSQNPIIPDNYYGSVDYRAIDSGSFANGWIGINFQNEDMANLEFNQESSALSTYKI